MSKKILRTDKTCLNCFHVVEKLHCPNCGQENIEPRKTFRELFVHFIEDLTHYENSFWKTIRNLVLKPASLTKEYLSGRRMSYLAPFRLYIFISFITFLFIALTPTSDFIANIEVTNSEAKLTPLEDNFDFGYKNVAELDSIQNSAVGDEKLDPYEFKIARKLQSLSDKYTFKELLAVFGEAFVSNLPKLLFIYLPLFAFTLFLFESKKRWYYFDHGIFTLHYFSFLLLMLLFLEINVAISEPLSHLPLVNFLSGLIKFVISIYALYYFFPAHHRFYGGSRVMTIIKGSIIFVINLFIMLFLFIAVLFYIVLYKIH